MALDPKSFIERKHFPDMRYIENSMAQNQDCRHSPIRGPISPSRSSTKLMRQISALGMEDPIFCTTEDVPEHPSNIFDDMGLDDVPSDMLDLMSVASDPTATDGAGLDESFLQLNRVYIMESSFLESMKKQCNESQATLKLAEDMSDRGFSILRDNKGPKHISKRRIGMIHSQSAAHRIQSNQSNRLNSFKRPNDLFVSSDHPISYGGNECSKKDPWNASMVSVDVNGVLSCSYHSKFDDKANYSSNCAMKDPLLMEAALALERQQSRRAAASKVELSHTRHSTDPPSLTPTGGTSSSPPKERRVLPTLSGLFSP